MESYAKYYTKFVRPPFAPIFTPTPEEFADPIAYVAKIRHEAEPYGVVKIVPPDNFKPPLAIDAHNFEFTPRIQRLNEIDAVIREKLVFDDRLHHFWDLKGQPFVPTLVDGKYVNLHKLHRWVQDSGGFDFVEKKKSWNTVAKKMNHKTSSKLREIYIDAVLPFIKTFESYIENEDVKFCKGSSNPQSMQGGNRRPAGRMMAGLSIRTSPRKNIQRQVKIEDDPVANVICMICGRGDEEDMLLLCDNSQCHNSCHTFCCDPKLPKIPENEWMCLNCVAKGVAERSSEFGFYDAQQAYTIHTFKEYADKFKGDYFHTTNIEDVPSDIVEKEFWKSVIDENRTVAVKYGADLITSKVGSGFPRKTDDHRGPDIKTKQFYANHAWNLNNLPVLKESVLSHIDTDISGMMVPWVYVGMCFSTFCWHTEDHWTYSINYNHIGEKKIWYGISGQEAEKFEAVVREIAPELTGHQKDIFHHMTTAVNPALLRAKGVNVYTVHQNAGEFVITFPRAYHAGYNEGFNLAEAVNFAPIDWLSSGRMCITEYANVRRFCVFSHDELVLKMVNSCDKLGIAMSLASLDEMKVIVAREQRGRQAIRRKGIKRHAFEEFEKLEDDARCCRKCRTTVFLSALSCTHNTVCLDHIDDICKQCTSSECTLRYRFTMEELEPLITKLEQRTTGYFDWANAIEELLDEKKHKPKLGEVEEFIEQAKRNHFPHTTVLQRLLVLQRSCHSVMDRVNQILHGKIKTRKETRIQRADTRLDMGGVRELIAEIMALPCDMKKIQDDLENLLVKVEQWCDTVADAIENDCGVDILEELRQLGENYELRTPQMDDLRKAIERQEWRKKVLKVVRWKPIADMEDDDDFISRDRWSLELVQRWVREASELGVPQTEQTVFHELVRTAGKYNATSERLSAGTPTIEQIEDLWKEVRNYDWCASKGIDWLRREILQARDFDYKEISTDLNLKKLTKVLDKSQRSTILSSTDSHAKLVEIQNKLLRFTQRMISLFKPRNAYYSLPEIISDRDDLAALIEGQAQPRTLELEYENLVDEWDELYTFSSLDDLKSHLKNLREQEANLLRTMKQVNASRSLRETCVCGIENTSCQETVSCMICRCRYHATCCEWNNFFGNLPLGSFLCVRCLRGKRPCIEDVQAAANAAPANALEVVLVKNLIEKVRHLTKESNELMKRVPQQGEIPVDLKQKAEQIIEGILGSELVDFTTFNRVSKMIPFVFGDLLAAQSKLMMAVRDRPVNGKPSAKLFYSDKKTKKRSASGRESKKEKKRKWNKSDSSDELCAAEKCCRPYGDQIGWIQCEPGCSRWYHYICVGLTVDGAKSIQVYSCSRCTSGNQE